MRAPVRGPGEAEAGGGGEPERCDRHDARGVDGGVHFYGVSVGRDGDRVAEPGADAADEDGAAPADVGGAGVGGAGAAGGSDGLRGILVGRDVAARAGGGERRARGAVRAAMPAGDGGEDGGWSIRG